MKIQNLKFLSAITLLFLCFAELAMSQTVFDKTKLDKMFDELESNDRMMGSVLLAKNGKVIYTRTIGYRDISAQGKVKSDSETMFRIGSITKTFTAVLIFRLIEEKKLALDTKLSKFFPNIANADQITIGHLLAHCSGLPNYLQGVNYDDPKSWIFQPQTKEQILARITPLKPIFAPGEKRQYSNTNYALLGYIIESVTGSTYNQYFEENIARKIGLKRTHFDGKINSTNNEARSFYWNDSKWNQNSEEDLNSSGGAGALVSTNADLAKFIYTLFSTNKILSQNSQKEMITPFLEKSEDSTKGIGVGISEIGNLKKKVYQHDGGIDGFTSLLTYIPEDGVVLSIVINGHNYPQNKIYKAILKTYYNQPLEMPSFKVIKLSDEMLKQYEGSYTFKEIGMTITIKKGTTNLIAQANGQDTFAVEPINETSFAHNESGIIIEFKKNPDGTIPYFDLYQQRGSLRFLKDAAK